MDKAIIVVESGRRAKAGESCQLLGDCYCSLRRPLALRQDRGRRRDELVSAGPPRWF